MCTDSTPGAHAPYGPENRFFLNSSVYWRCTCTLIISVAEHMNDGAASTTSLASQNEASQLSEFWIYRKSCKICGGHFSKNQLLLCRSYLFKWWSPKMEPVWTTNQHPALGGEERLTTTWTKGTAVSKQALDVEACSKPYKAMNVGTEFHFNTL